MGCCVSSTDKSSPSAQQKLESLKPNLSAIESRAPPPTFEEESVKEVLSEVPKPKPPSSPPPPPIKELLQEDQFDSYQQVLSFLDKKIKENGNACGKNVLPEDGISEIGASEVCSLSYGESASTATFTDDRRGDDDADYDEVKQRVKRSPAKKLPPRNRSFTGDPVPKRENSIGKSPARRSDQSPGRINNAGIGGSARLIQTGEWGAGRRGARSEPNRRDPGESSGRRSRSPATNRSAISRSPSARRTNRSPGRFIADPPESNGSSKRVESGTEGRWASTSSNSNGGGSTNESLENPLVSLECFIFL